MANIKIAFINESTVLSDDEVKAALPALQRQVTRDFAPIWGVEADLGFLLKTAPIPPGTWLIGIFDNSDQPGALGYHDLTQEGLPLAKVFAGTDLQYGSAWTVTASHELLEMLGDPDINLYAFSQKGMEIFFYGYEVCDACEADELGYQIDGVLVSDFVYPAWFEGFRAQGSTQFDYQNQIQSPFELLKGGYISIFDVSYNSGFNQLYPTGAELDYRARPHVGSRRERRATAREQWMRSTPRGGMEKPAKRQLPKGAAADTAHVFAPRGKQMVSHPKAAFKVHPRKTKHFKVSVDPGLGQAGAQIADALLQTCEQDFVTLQGFFGGITPKGMPFHLIVTSGSDGASHQSCAGTALSIGANSGPVPFMRSLVIAEADEVFEANFGHGWNCGFSNGEGLSRVLANDMVPGVEPQDFVSPPVWLDGPSDMTGILREDWINKTEQTDRNYFSIGCAVLFLNWLRFQLNFSWTQIIAAGAPTLAGTYKNLTGKNDGFKTFKALIDLKFPPGQLSNLTTDNPFPLL